MFQRGINLCGIESEMATTTPSTGDVVKPVVWKNSTSGYSSSNCGYAGFVSSSSSMASKSLDNCGSQCVAISTCNYFSFSNSTCSFLTFASLSAQPLAYVDPTQSCGSVIKRPIFNWTTNGTVQTSSNCDFTLIGSYSSATIPGTSTLDKCITYCTTTYPSYCNFFTLSTAGVCTLKKSTTKPSPVINSANSNCGWVPSQFTG